MTNHLEIPPAETLEEANRQRDHWINIACNNEKRHETIYLKVVEAIKNSIDPSLHKHIYLDSTLPGGEISTSGVPQVIVDIINYLKSDNKKQEDALRTIYILLGVFPYDTTNIKQDILDILKKHQDEEFSQTLIDVYSRLLRVEEILNCFFDKDKDRPSSDHINKNTIRDKKSYMDTVSIPSYHTKLTLPGHFVDGQIQINYMRDTDGKEYDFHHSRGMTAFKINVPLSLELLEKLSIPEVKGVIENDT